MAFYFFFFNFPTFLFLNRVIDVETYDKRKERYKKWKKYKDYQTKK